MDPYNVLKKSLGNFRKSLKISHPFVFDVQKLEKLTQCLLGFLETYTKIMHFLPFS